MEGSDTDEKVYPTHLDQEDPKLSSDDNTGLEVALKELLNVVAPEAAGGGCAPGYHQFVAERNTDTESYKMYRSGSKLEPIWQAVWQSTPATPAAQKFDPVKRRETDDLAVSLEANSTDVKALVANEPQPLQHRDAQTQAAVDAVQNRPSSPEDQPQAQPQPLVIGEEEDGRPVYYNFTITDHIAMRLALAVASKCEISKYAQDEFNVGCVILRSTSKDQPDVFTVASNSFLPNTSEDFLEKKAAQYKGTNEGLTSELGLHAEVNALRNCSGKNATVYVTHLPCRHCAKELIAHGVKLVFYLFWIGKNKRSIELFKKYKVSCIPFPGESHNSVLKIFKEKFPTDHKICVEDDTQDIPKEGSFHLSKEDSTGGTYSDLKRCMRDIDSLTILVKECLHEIREQRKQHSIKIMGVPEESLNETAKDTSDLCVSLFKAMGAEINIHDINIAQRTAKGRDSDGPRPIICKFVSQLARDSVMSAQQQACNVNPVKIGFSEGTDISKIRICDYDEDSQEMTKGASSTR